VGGDSHPPIFLKEAKMEQELGFKELYEVSLKATYPIEVSGKTIEVDETVASFDRI
jgi:hypothetical protein